jgi:type I restriction-modification system DNA methylase subunit
MGKRMKEEIKKLCSGFKWLYKEVKKNPDITEEELRTKFRDSNVLETLGYTEVGKDIRIEKKIPKEGKISDIRCLDDYKNVIFVIEFKNPKVTNLKDHFNQLWERYVKPLRARYGILTNGIELLVYERIDTNFERKLKISLAEITVSQCEDLYEWLRKPKINRTVLVDVLEYFSKFDKPKEKISLASEVSQKHFFDSFELKEGSVFADLVGRTIELFDFERERSKFLRSAYTFWKSSYAKEPEKLPNNWKKIMDEFELPLTRENILKFMFCLETAYSLFTRLILAKACEDYKLPGIDFSDFIKTEIKRSAWRGRDISLLAWAITTMELIENMKQKLVKSVFEGDIFYWWVDSYRGLRGDILWSSEIARQKPKAHFGEALAEVILTLYKFDFSEIVGDPLGTLYQKYFDKETRRALGEFYTPQEVVEYIVDGVGYSGKAVLNKRLLDPACGSGTFLVEALKRYLSAARDEAKENGWDIILGDLCNKFKIVGFDIHPFATFMAQMQFMLVLIPFYKQAIDQNPRFVLNRLPIFRTDSLLDETKGGKLTLKAFENGTRFISVDTMLPISEGTLKIRMPYDKDAISDRTSLLNVEEYFGALQAVFDTVKGAAWRGEYKVNEEDLKRNFKFYLQDKDWDKLVTFFKPYTEHLMEKFKILKDTFGDGRLIKSIEDIILAAILKGYIKYDFVVGNPPYVRQEKIREIKNRLQIDYCEIFDGRADLSIYFIYKGICWLGESGKFGYITTGKFMKAGYGKYIRAYVPMSSDILQLLDLRGSKVFKDATNDPVILILNKETSSNKLSYIRLVNDIATVPQEQRLDATLDHIKKHIGEIYQDEFIWAFDISKKQLLDNLVKERNKYCAKFGVEAWVIVPSKTYQLFKKIRNNSTRRLGQMFDVYRGIRTGCDEAFKIDKKKSIRFNIERKLLKSLVKGKDIEKWKINFDDSYIIYIDKDIDIEDYSNAKRYLLNFKTKLKNRAQYKQRKQREEDIEWYMIEQPLSPEVFESKKLLIKRINQNYGFAYDSNGLYALDTCCTLVPKEDFGESIFYVLGILNSKVGEIYLKLTCRYLGKQGYEYEKQYLECFPIRLPQTPYEEKLAVKITEKVNLILEKVRLEQKTEKFPEEYIKEYRNRGVEFNSIPITFNSGHKELTPVIEKNVSGEGYNIIVGKKEKSIFVDSIKKAEYVQLSLKGRKVRKNDRLQLLVPKSDSIVNDIIEQWKRDREKVEEAPTVSTLEDRINELVYELYGLDEDDKKVIEEFLERF